MTDDDKIEDGKLRILYLLSDAYFGGTSTLILELLRGVDRTKVDIFLASPDGTMLDEFRKYASGTLVLAGKDNLSITSLLTIVNYIKSNSIKVVHTFLPPADLVGGVAAKLCGIDSVSTILAFYYAKGGVKKKLFSLIYRSIYMLHKSVVAVSNAVKTDLHSRIGIKVPSDKVDLIYNGVREPRALACPDTVRESLGFGEKDILVGMAGRMDRLKGFHVLLDAIPAVLDKHSTVKFVIVGDGIERKNLEQQSSLLKISEHVLFTGYIEGNVYDIIQSLDVVVLSSLSEGCPLLVLEAMAMEKPVVASDIPAIREIVEDNKTALLFSSGDSVDLSGKLTYLLSNPDQYVKFGKAGKNLFERSFSMEKMLAAYGEFYNRLKDADRRT